MAEAQLQQFLEKIRQLNALVALSEANPAVRNALRDCDSHHDVVTLAAQWGFDIGRRWGDRTEGLSTTHPSAHHPDQRNLLEGTAPAAGEEWVEVLVQTPAWSLERIHSCGSSSPPGFWYDQEENEWIMVLRGSATIEFADEAEPRDLCVGDSVLIEAHRRHRVVATDPAPGTLWLALFWRASA